MTDWTPPVRLFGEVAAATLNANWRDNISYLAENLPHQAVMWHSTSIVTAGNAIARNILPSQWFYRTWNQQASANNDAFTQSFWCTSGTYTISILARKTANGGLVDWALDGSSIATGMDFYNAVTQLNQVLTIVGVSISEPGRHVLTATVNGQTVGSGGYDVEITQLWVVRTGA